ncbi:MAG: SUMF1/EgtB/PvdO family nonheme iron enzyme, partial [Gemmataceae bacterium]|nr:SUMF1/EgtB/PvdO family nonheme iron enzyme [Gemmataceae bacterium]
DLAGLVARHGPLPVERACGYARQAALGLQHAHEKGLVHRDVKPSNLMVTPRHVVKILDLGLARLSLGTEGGSGGSALTQEGALMGTPDYLAPEQARDAHVVDGRADLYSLGCTLYFLLTGRPPFPGGSLAHKLLRHQQDEPPAPEAARADLPPALVAVLRRLLAKRPEDRYARAADVAAALAPFCPAGTVPGAPGEPVEPPGRTEPLSAAPAEHPGRAPAPGRRWPRPLVTAACSALLVAALAVWLWPSGSQTPPTAPPTAPPDLAGPGKRVHNSLGMALVWIPAGTFWMGGPDPGEKPVQDHEQPRHEVRITRPFLMGAYEVTQEEYQRVMGVNPSWFAATGERRGEVTGVDTRRYPVEYVSWEEANAFCARLSALAEEKRAGRLYRLPTEAQWEYACRAGTTTAFPFGNALSSAQANFNGLFPYGKAAPGQFLKRPCPVGSYPGNVWGLHDMHGNVVEWCHDWYDPNYYHARPRDDPPGPPAGGFRVARGGSWEGKGWGCRSAARREYAPKDHHCNVGFRVVCVPGQAP